MSDCCKKDKNIHQQEVKDSWTIGCSCCSCHDEKKTPNKKRFFSFNYELIKIISGSILFFTAIIIGVVAKINESWPYDFLSASRFILLVLAFFITGGQVLLTALKNISKGKIFDENFLMTIASVGAFIIGELPEAVAVMLFYQVGEWFQEFGVKKSRNSISALMKLRPEKVNIVTPQGVKTLTPEEVKVGTLIEVNPGERIPLDGIIQSGSAFLDTSVLTGESVPRHGTVGDEVLGGFINTSGVLHILTTKTVGASAIARVLNLVEQAGSKKAITERFITRFAKVYTPIVTLIALFLAVIPPLFFPEAKWETWIYRALIFLVVSCPCALVISVPLGFFGGIGNASKKGILIKGSSFLEALADVSTVVFDKTGTLTKGVFTVTKVNLSKTAKISHEELITLAAQVEQHSNHPIAVSLRLAHKELLSGKGIEECCKNANLFDVKEISGQGIKALLNGQVVLVGNMRLLKQEDVKNFFDEKINNDFLPSGQEGSIIYVAIDGNYVGNIVISDIIKPEAKDSISLLKKLGIKKLVMLTGDTKYVANQVAEELDIKEVFSDLMPEDKVRQVEYLLSNKASKNEKTLFVGDGINDAPVLARSDIGVAMGTSGSDAAIETADVVIMTDELIKLPEAIKIAKRTRKIVTQNIVFALGIKILVMVLGAAGFANMWAAVFADVGVSCLAVLNSMKQLAEKN